jgi:putative FmdB family regulatory protein
MPTYEYECTGCGGRFERRQAITDGPLGECPDCRGEVRRLVSGGSGFIVKGGVQGGMGGRHGDNCSLEDGGTTCCGRGERCNKPPCGSE